MRTIPKSFTCPTRIFNVIGLEVDPNGEDAELVSKVIRDAREHRADPHDTAGQMRPRGTQLVKRYLGVLAEDLLFKHLQAEFRHEARVIKEPFKTHKTHVDIEIHWHTGGKTTIEVRSSYHRIPLHIIVCQEFKTLGPYSTVRKPGETVKDFYLQGVLRQNFNIDGIHTLYFTGGAPGRWFLEKGTVSTLKQDGAEYLVLPMLEGMDAIEIVNSIRSIIYSK